VPKLDGIGWPPETTDKKQSGADSGFDVQLSALETMMHHENWIEGGKAILKAMATMEGLDEMSAVAASADAEDARRVLTREIEAEGGLEGAGSPIHATVTPADCMDLAKRLMSIFEVAEKAVPVLHGIGGGSGAGGAGARGVPHSGVGDRYTGGEAGSGAGGRRMMDEIDPVEAVRRFQE